MKEYIRKFAAGITNWAGSVSAVLLAGASLVGFLAVGYLFDYSEWYQIVANTWMSAVSYMMLFILQYAQARDTKALHLKIDELVYNLKGADNRLIGIERLSEEEMECLAKTRDEVVGERLRPPDKDK